MPSMRYKSQRRKGALLSAELVAGQLVRVSGRAMIQTLIAGQCKEPLGRALAPAARRPALRGAGSRRHPGGSDPPLRGLAFSEDGRTVDGSARSSNGGSLGKEAAYGCWSRLWREYR